MTGGTAFMRNKQSLSRAIQRKRVSMKGYPSRPKTFDDLELIPSNLMRTTDDQPFLILNETIIHGDTTPGAKRILVFMSQTGRDILGRCTNWFVDGTFKSAAHTLFSQVIYTIFNLAFIIHFRC
jgi:hypothetical protein